MKQIFSNLINEESGQDLIEYALVTALIALGAIAALNTLSGKLTTAFTNIGNAMTTGS